MRRMSDVDECHEVIEELPSVHEVGEGGGWKWEGPFVAEALFVEMDVGTGDLLVVRVAMGRATEVQSGENNDTSSAVLVCSLNELDLAARNL